MGLRLKRLFVDACFLKFRYQISDMWVVVLYMSIHGGFQIIQFDMWYLSLALLNIKTNITKGANDIPVAIEIQV